ncbi:hypothetical protein D3C80_1017150 [compost metagenome]
MRDLIGAWNGKDGPWGDWREYYSENHLPPSYGWGMGPQHKDDAYSNIAQVFRVNGTSLNAPGNAVYGAVSLPCDGGPSTAYLAIQNSGRAFVGYSNKPENGVIWTEVYTVKNPPTAAGINALPLSGGTMGGEVKSTSPTIWRSIQGGYGAMWYMNASSTYFLLTNKGDANGNYNNLRPLAFDNATGAVEIGTSLHIANNEGLTVGVATRVAGDGNIWGTRWNANGQWLWDAITELVNGRAGKFTASTGQSGWRRDPDTGIVEQWMYCEGNHSGAPQGQWFNFPIAFPSRCDNVQLTCLNSTNAQSTYPPQVSGNLPSNTGVSVCFGSNEYRFLVYAVGV